MSDADLEQFARRQLRPGDHVVLEATMNTWAVVRLLKPHVASVSVANPLKVKHIAEAHVKTDKIDAEVLAQLLRCNYLPKVWQPDETTSLLRELTARRTAFVAQRTAIRNRIQSTLMSRLLRCSSGKLFSVAGLAWLATLELDAPARLLIDCELALHAAVEQQIEVLDAELAKHSHENENVKLLMTLPGVNVTVADAVLAALGDVQRFASGDHAASYLGLTPRTRQSAAKCYHGSITKAGNSQARWMLVEAAQSVSRHPGPLGHFFRKLARKKNRNVAIVATARKLVTIAVEMLKRREPYRYAVPRSTEQKLASLRVRATGERRRGGSAKGAKRQPARLPGGARRVKSLSEVYRSEQLPPLTASSTGERRAVEQSGARRFVASLEQSHLIPRSAGKGAAKDERK